jgi:LAS superfamily LD-carboxypeptidase LdcB
VKKIITGKTKEHLVLDNYSNLLVHPEMLSALIALRNQARDAGFLLEMTSAFRGFDQQLSIWNAKARGERTLFSDQGLPLEYATLSPKEIVFAILRWSALPGSSRHHWGTDIDVFDKSRMPEDYKVQLLPQETEPGGIFGEFHIWLDKNLEHFDFFRPYEIDKGGIAPEKWHLSYKPVSDIYMKELTYKIVEDTIIEADIEFKSIILDELPEIYQRFIIV